ncbi:hypothetical protein LTS18_013664 [Coniosporium uncinatum]|uniref:Uncharacterized protein n=1 Tax=Coniosporium uncinatum TaxID=93489 RepID=A0ACC3DC04_9PEZI|nr:hypothetical protein LTS18_013664 [Coniosporium uncinatum]
MFSSKSVLAFGDRLKALPHLDAFIANAGVDTTRFERFEGNESMLTVNVISTLLIAMLALPKLRETSTTQQNPTHLTLTGSVIHIFAKDEYLSKPKQGHIFSSLNDEKNADMNDRYPLSKLLELLAFRQLVTEFDRATSGEEASVIVNYANPG